MPAVTLIESINAIREAIHESGYSAALAEPMRGHPRRFVCTGPGSASIALWVYAWTLTSGGRPSLRDEYRIQMTAVRSPLAMNPNGLTVLIGYEPGLRLFAGFDIIKHQTFTPGSPSVQINIRTVRDALQYGLSFERKSNDEIAVGIRPDQFIAYALNAKEIHCYGRRPKTFDLLARATTLTTSAPEVEILPEPRRRVVQEISRLSRDANFRRQVLHAYGNRCAVTRMQLRLVDSAHIVPVGVPGSTDETTNGLALSPTYHRAYDQGLIFLNEHYMMCINPVKAAQLQLLDLAGGLDGFLAPLGKILLPPDPVQWPGRKYIRQANRARLI